MRALMLRLVQLNTGRSRNAAATLPGLAVCAMVALAAAQSAAWSGSPAMLCALLLGTALHYLSQEVRTAPGVAWCGSFVLRLGVGLLGARITTTQVALLGWPAVCIVLAAVASTLLCGMLVGRWLGLPRSLAILAGGATAICGASAALAIAAVLPRNEALEKDTLAVVVLATLLSTLAMLLYPLVARALALPPEFSGIFIGGTIHDVAQVVVAGYALGPQAGDAASIVKLFRVALLVLVVAGVAAACRSGYFPQATTPVRLPPVLPPFLVLFLLLAALNSASTLPAPWPLALRDGSQACLMVGVAALGMKTSFVQLARAGWRQGVLMMSTTLWIGVVVLLAVLYLRHRALLL